MGEEKGGKEEVIREEKKGKRENGCLFSFPEMDRKGLGSEYEEHMRKYIDNFAIGWKSVLHVLDENCQYLEKILIFRQRGFLNSNIDAEIVTLDDGISACFSKMNIKGRGVKEDAMRKLQNLCRGEMGKLQSMLNMIPLGREEVPSQYMNDVLELMEKYIVIRRRYKNGSYLG